MPRTFAALRHRNYRLFFAGQLISVSGTWMQNLALSWLIYQLTNSAFLLGVISSLGSLPMALFAIPGGVLADRVDRRRIMLVTQSSAMVLAFVLAALTGGHWIRVWQVAVLAVFSGTVMACDMPARQAFVVEMVAREDLMNAIALNSSIFNAGRIIGPSIAGALVAVVGVAWCFFINGLSFIAVLVALVLMRIPRRPRRPEVTGVMADALGGLRYVRSNSTVLRMAVMLAVFSIFGWSYAVLMPVFARDVLHVGARGLGYLMTSSGVGALAGALTVASGSGRHLRRLLFGGAVLMSASLVAFSFSRVLPLSALLLALVGMGGLAFMSAANTTIQLSVPDEVRGRMMGVWGLVIAGTAPLGSLQAGAMAEYLGAPAAVRLGACIMAAATLAAIVVVRRRARGEPREEE
ncbi:MAG TPA: MFS transporter [Armatimonadota bacterium]|nr:MFS transporter [Armatimonadota bacterium]